MKFYRDKFNIFYLHKIINNNLTAILFYDFTKSTQFFKNGKKHNSKKAAYISTYGTKQFYLNDKYYGHQDNFIKKTWRKFVKLQTFL
jgi:hypothetical protein